MSWYALLCIVPIRRWRVCRCVVVLSWWICRVPLYLYFATKNKPYYGSMTILYPHPLVLNLKYQQCVLATGVLVFFIRERDSCFIYCSVATSLSLLRPILRMPFMRQVETMEHNERISKTKPGLGWPTWLRRPYYPVRYAIIVEATDGSAELRRECGNSDDDMMEKATTRVWGRRRRCDAEESRWRESGEEQWRVWGRAMMVRGDVNSGAGTKNR